MKYLMRNRFAFLLLALSFCFAVFINCSDKILDGGPDNGPDYTNLDFVAKGAPFTYHDHGVSANFPLWAPDGQSIYYLNILGEWWQEPTYQHKQIYRINPIGSEPEIIFEDNYLFLAISGDGSTLASSIDITPTWEWGFPGGNPIVLIDIASGVIDTLPLENDIAIWTSPVFSLSGDSLFFYATYVDSAKGDIQFGYYWGGFFVYDLNARTYQQLFDEDPFLVAGFDLIGGGTRIVSAGKIRNLDGTLVKNLKNVGMWQRISPDGKTVVGSFGWDFPLGDKVKLAVLPSDSLLRTLELNDKLIYSEFNFSPDGSKILMSVSQPLQPSGFYCGPSQIFMYSLDQNVHDE